MIQNTVLTPYQLRPPSVHLPSEAIDGMIPNTLESLRLFALTLNTTFSVNYTLLSFPFPNDPLNTDRNINQTLNSDVFGSGLIFDCVLRLEITQTRMDMADFTIPIDPYGMIVITSLPSVVGPVGWTRWMSFTLPFSLDLWLGLLGMALVSAVMIALFEGGKGVNPHEFSWWCTGDHLHSHGPNQEVSAKQDLRSASWESPNRSEGEGEDGGSTPRGQLFAQTLRRSLSKPANALNNIVRSATDPHGKIYEWGNRLGYGLYRGITSLCSEGINSVTVAGRIYLSGICFCALVFCCSYQSSLAALFISQMTVSPQILNIHDFISQGVPCCVRNLSTFINFAKNNYPNMQLYITDNTDLSLADNILAGNCAGAIGMRSNLLYMMNKYPQGCALQMVGRNLNSNYFSIPWKKTTVDSNGNVTYKGLASSINFLMSGLMGNGTLDKIHDYNFPIQRVMPCSKGPNTISSLMGVQLDLQDLAGLFIIQAILTGLAILVHIASKLRQSHVKKVANVSKKARSFGRKLAAIFTPRNSEKSPRLTPQASAAELQGPD